MPPENIRHHTQHTSTRKERAKGASNQEQEEAGSTQNTANGTNQRVFVAPFHWSFRRRIGITPGSRHEGKRQVSGQAAY